MIRETLDDIPQYVLPPGYSLRRYQPGDERSWTAIHVEADLYNTITPALFGQQFGSDPVVLRERQFYVCDPDGRAIGTATAWFDDHYRGRRYGRVHWVAIVPAMQGRGLSKPLMTAVCNRLRELGHDRVYLTTSAARLPAVHLYLKFGFVPEIAGPQDEALWREILRRLTMT